MGKMILMPNRNEVPLLKQWAHECFGANLKPGREFTFEEAIELHNEYQTEWGEYVRAHSKTKRQDINTGVSEKLGPNIPAQDDDGINRA